MSVLLACEVETGRFQKVLVARNIRKDGGLSLSDKWNGTVESYVVRSAAKFFAADSAAVEMSYEIGSQKFRATRF